MLGVERLGGAVLVRVGHRLVPPEVAALGHRAVLVGSLDHHHVLEVR
jgi:hypothetical protein